MSFAEDQDAVGEFGPNSPNESCGEAVRSRTTRWALHGVDPGVSHNVVERGGALSVTNEEPERGGAVVEVHQQVAAC